MRDNEKNSFIHRQSAHCESGGTSNILLNYGVDVSEALVFGIGAGLFFGFFPFIKMNGLPVVTFRNMPGRILKNTSKRLGIKIESYKFKNPEKSMDALDILLDKGIPVGLQAGCYWLPYFPDALRFHFNAHTLIAIGRKGDEYLISDPVFEEPVTCLRKDLMKARFSEGPFSPKGKMYCIKGIKGQVDLPRAVTKGIRETCWFMLAKNPIPLIGVRGIRYFAKRVQEWPEKYGKRRASLLLGNAIRMQEEVGTGGGGFRLMYAAFLQEAADILNKKELLDISERMTETGDKWREFALLGARICKDRSLDGDNYDNLSNVLLDCAAKEYGIYNDLRETVR
ncbi:MAG: peptidase [Syntrophus sp. (in: bacteria)]|nr:peptidase [Syntrophus sp. (in: bacteria)]